MSNDQKKWAADFFTAFCKRTPTEYWKWIPNVTIKEHHNTDPYNGFSTFYIDLKCDKQFTLIWNGKCKNLIFDYKALISYYLHLIFRHV